MFVKIRSKNKVRGIGLLELMLSLAIIAILLVMATRYFISANESQKINNAISQIHGVAGGAANYYVAHNGYAAMTTATLVTEQFIPPSLGGAAGDGVGANPWGGNVTTAVVAAGGYTVALSAVPATSCTKLASMLNGSTPGGATCAAGVVTATFR